LELSLKKIWKASLESKFGTPIWKAKLGQLNWKGYFGKLNWTSTLGKLIRNTNLESGYGNVSWFTMQVWKVNLES
jgi:hypothetical protein